MQADRCTFHKRTRGLPRSRQEPQGRAALDRGQAPATRGTTSDFTSDAAKAAVAASLVSRMAFVFPERVTIWLEAAVAVHCLREVCRPGGIGAARSTANYCSGMAYLRRHLFKRGRTTSIRQESKKRRSSDPRQVVVMSMMVRSLQQKC